MITVIRKHLKGATYKISLWIIILILGIGFIPSLLRHSTTGGPWALRVNGQEIGYKEYAFEVAEQRDRIAGFRAQYGQYADMLLEAMGVSADPRRLAYESLVREELINQTTQKLVIHLSADYIADKLNDSSFLYRELASYVPLYSLGQDSDNNQKILRAHLQRKGISISDFERKVERVIARDLVVDLVTAASYVPLFELEQQYQISKLGKSFSILTFSRDEFIKTEKQKDISEKELKDFFDRENAQNKRYWVPEKRSGVVWKIKPESYGITVSDDQIKAYYEEHKSSNKYIKTPAQVQVRTILFKVDDAGKKEEIRTKVQSIRSDLMKDPARFAEIARTVSDDEKTKKDGGLVPLFAKNEKEPSFERAAFLLKEKDAISEVIETGEGFQLLQLVDKKPRTVKSLNEVRADINQELILKEFKDLFVRDAKKAIEREGGVNSSVEGQDTLKDFVESKKATKKTMTDVEQNSSKEVQALFKIPKVQVGADESAGRFNPQATYYIEGNEGVIVQLTEVEKRYLPSLEKIKNTVMQDLYAYKASNSLRQALEKVRLESATKSFEQLKETYGGTLEKTSSIKPDDEKQLKKLKEKGIPTDILFQLEKKGSTLAQETKLGGVVVRLDAIEAFNPEDFATQQADLGEVLEKEQMRQLIEGFVASLHRNATIETNESLFASQA
ncbi:MAG: peptidylprolyl isomerase [bacterium]|nr:peptidylprolyl isomerase [bacterium]